MIDKRGLRIFKAQHLVDGEIPKLFEFVTSNFDEEACKGEFLLDEKERPIKDENGRMNDIEGRKVNKLGYLIDKHGNIVDQNGRLQFKKEVLGNGKDIPNVFKKKIFNKEETSKDKTMESRLSKIRDSSLQKSFEQR